jgi:phytoene dehydrogenase-like protein
LRVLGLIITAMSARKKVIIVGAGISGLTAGIYLLDNGYEVTIYEKNPLPGGVCMGWYRKGIYIEGCAHWIVGANPSSNLFPLWKHIGAISDEKKTYSTSCLSEFELSDGRIFHFYSSLKSLYKEMVSFFPEDKALIREFIYRCWTYRFVRVPVKKPVESMNVFEKLFFGLKMAPMGISYLKYRHVSVGEFASRAKSKDLASVFTRYLSSDYNMHSFFYLQGTFSRGESGLFEGGSLAMSLRIADRFKSEGGLLCLSSPVKEIILEDGVAKGIKLESGETKEADFVISSADAHFTFANLLGGKIKDPYFEKRFADRKSFPLISAFQFSFATKKDITHLPNTIDCLCSFELLGRKVSSLSVRSFAFDKSLCRNGYTPLTVLLLAKEGDYAKLKAMDKNEYIAYKNEKGTQIASILEKKAGLEKGDIELLDVATPLTYEHYTNAYEGSYMSFLSTKFSKELWRKGNFKGAKNFFYCGQWTMSPGGLPIALFTGKHAAYRIAKADGKKFINKEKESVSPSLTKAKKA